MFQTRISGMLGIGHPTLKGGMFAEPCAVVAERLHGMLAATG